MVLDVAHTFVLVCFMQLNVMEVMNYILVDKIPPLMSAEILLRSV